MSIENEVLDFVADFLSIDRNEIDLDTLVNDDLGVDGDDGTEFLKAFSMKFDVDIDVIDKNYFDSEGFPFIFSLIIGIYKVLFFRKRNQIIYSPLSIKTLVESAKNKVWSDN